MTFFVAWLGLTLTSILVHAVLFRISRGRRHILSLLLVFSGFQVIGWTCGLVLVERGPWILASLAHAISFPVYLVFYTATVGESPSAALVEILMKYSKDGADEATIRKEMHERRIVEDRIGGLLQGGQMKESDGQLVVTPKGRFYLEFFLLPRRLMGRYHYGA